MDSSSAVIDAAIIWASEGVHVQPVAIDDAFGVPIKAPVLGKDWPSQSTTDSTVIRRWFSGRYRNCGLGIQVGPISGLLVIDLDVKHDGVNGITSWKELVAKHGKVKTYTERTPSGGVHLFFAHPGGEEIRNGENVLAPGIDIRANDGGNLVVFPTPGYVVLDGSDIAPCPSWLSEAILAAQAKPEASGGGSVASTMAYLLDHPPTKGEIWTHEQHLFGHLIKHIPYKDACKSLIMRLGMTWPDGLHDNWEKQFEELWEEEHEKRQATADHSLANGFLVGATSRLHTLVRSMQQGAPPVPAEIGDFDLKATHLATGADERIYVGELLRARDNSGHEFVVSSKTLNNAEKLDAWLGSFGVTVAKPPAEAPHAAKVKMGSRLARYMESQKPVDCEIAHFLGEQDNGVWLHHDGVIGDSEQVLVAHPKLREWAPFHYGFDHDEQEVVEVLREVMTFHELEICAVFGAWWTMTAMKGRLLAEHASMFPFMAVEAPSESGKTSGYFALMMQLNGSKLGPGGFTKASFRDYVSAHRNGIVWLDDATDVADLETILRLSTGQERMAKKGQNNFSQESVQLVAPIVVSGEGMESLFTEQAMADRSVVIEPPNPKRRPSLRDPSKLQYEDILELQRRYGRDLSVLAGTLVQAIRKRSGMLPDYRGLKTLPGRSGEKVATLRMGARILGDILGEDHWVALVDHWCQETAEGAHSSHFLLHKMYPFLWREAMFPRKPGAMFPVYLDRQNRIWVSDALCADRWARVARTPRERQLGALHSIQKLRRGLGVDGKGQRKDTRDPDTGMTAQSRYHRLDATSSEIVIAQSEYVTESDIDVTESTLTLDLEVSGDDES